MGLVPSPISLRNVKNAVLEVIQATVGDALSNGGARWPDKGLPQPQSPFVRMQMRSLRRSSNFADTRSHECVPTQWTAQLLDVADNEVRGLEINGVIIDRTTQPGETVEQHRDGLLILIQSGTQAVDPTNILSLTASASSTDTIVLDQVTPGSVLKVVGRSPDTWAIASTGETYVKVVRGHRMVTVSLNFYSDDLRAEVGALDLAQRFEMGISHSDAARSVLEQRKVSLMEVRQLNNLPELATVENHGRAQIDVVLSASVLFVEQASNFDLSNNDWFDAQIAS